MPFRFYAKTKLIGGSKGALDKEDGKNLNNGDIAVAITIDGFAAYVLKDNLKTFENPPNMIRPRHNAGKKAWVIKVPNLLIKNNLFDNALIRYNAKSKHFESCAQPREFLDMILTPRNVAPPEREGTMWYKKPARGIFVGVRD